MHYAVPQILENAGLLHQLHTDLVAPAPNTLLRRALQRFASLSTSIQRLLSRAPARIPREKIVAYPWLALIYAARLRYSLGTSKEKVTFLWAGRRFAKCIVRNGLGGANAVYLFNSAALEVLQAARNQGCFCVLEQTIAPMRIEASILTEERSRWIGWEADNEDAAVLEEFIKRETQEWTLADLVICGSEFVAEGVRRSAPSDPSCVVIPYGVPRPSRQPQTRPGNPRVLNVLFVGTVSLRKGIQYLYEAAKRLSPTRFAFRAIGPSTLTPSALREIRKRIEVWGPVPRTEIESMYRWADVFVLPSLCEGSATVTYEALALGLPVITTPNSGTVVRDGIDGYIVPVRDPSALAEKLEALHAQPDLRAHMSHQALDRAAQFTQENYGQRLIAAVQDRWQSITATAAAPRV